MITRMQNGSLGDDRRALYLAGICDGFEVHLVRESADLGYAPAQAYLAQEYCRGDLAQMLRWSQLSASQGYREGCFFLAICYHEGCHCEEDFGKAAAQYKEAAELGSVQGQFAYGVFAFGEHDIERFRWLRRSMQGGHGHARRAFLEGLQSHVTEYQEHARLVFEMGELFEIEKGNMIDGVMYNSDSALLVGARRCVELHLFWTNAAREALVTWTCCAKKVIGKDVRGMISRMLWEERWRWSALEHK